MSHAERPRRARDLVLPVALAAALAVFFACTAPPPAPDPAVAELAERARAIEADVAALRGLEFRSEVPVRLAGDAEFRAYVDSRLALVGTEAERAAMAEVYKLLALVPPDLDVWGATIDGLSTQVGGWYDPADGTFSIVGGLGETIQRAVLAHELVHALDDQHYELDPLMTARDGDSDAQTAVHAVAEGAAMLVQNRWVLDHRAELDLGQLSEASTFGGTELFELPEALWLPTLFLYMRGAAFLANTELVLAAQLAAPNPERIDAAYTDPPRSTEQILHPAKYWDASLRDDPVAVAFDAAELPGDWAVAYSDTLGEQALSSVVRAESERQSVDLTDPMSLLRLRYTEPAAEGWDGDRVVLLAAGDSRVLRLRTEWDSPEDAAEFAAAMEARLPALRANAAALAGDGPSQAAVTLAGDTGVEVTVLVGLATGGAEELLDPERFAVAVPTTPLEAPSGGGS